MARRGRTNPIDGEAPPPPADDAAAEGGEGGEGGEGDVPDWCNPTKEMGAWLNFMKIRVICGERGNMTRFSKIVEILKILIQKFSL